MIKKFEDFLNESTIGEFTGKKKTLGFFGKDTEEWKKHQEDNKTVEEWRKTAKEIYKKIDDFKPGECAKMWDYVVGKLNGIRFALISKKGKSDNNLTTMGKMSAEAGWCYCPGWDSWCKIKDLDKVYTYESGLGYYAKSGDNKDLLEYGINWVRGWIKQLLLATIDTKNGYDEFENNTFYNCKNPDEIIKKVKEDFKMD